MSKKSTSLTGAVSRRTVLQGIGAAGLIGAAPAFSRRAFAAGDITIRWWSTQASPDQLAMYKNQINAFEAENPGVKVLFEPTSDEGYPAQLAAAFASGQVPNVLTHLPSFAAQNYYGQGLVEPMDDVIAAIGEQNYFPGANDVYKTADGHYCGTPIGNTAADMLWLRKDLMEKAGIDKKPETFDELREACRKMQGGGIYGAPLPYGLNSMTSLIFIGFIHRAGGQVFSKDLDIALDSQGTYDALEFYQSMREFCPPGASNYSWGESLTAFVSGASATGIYAGRVLANVTAQNPAIADYVTCAVYPTISPDVNPWTFNDFPSVFIPAGASNMDMTKKFAAFLFQPAGYIPQLHAAPGHILPVLKTIANDPAYLDNPIIQKYEPEVELMANAAAKGKNLGYEENGWKPNVKANDIIASNAIAEMVQRVVLNGENAKTVVKDTSDKIESIMAE
ncbi:ABC transporter substrate-binding protein [Martelella limonii]|uniref:ABC transporter substrate-binding protein n=1 Tax=Martelella limonii TaxID=1647649 RepID=UPI0015810EF7|nr:ABC transporter substrate-binding protein [Martelella limonii]